MHKLLLKWCWHFTSITNDFVMISNYFSIEEVVILWSISHVPVVSLLSVKTLRWLPGRWTSSSTVFECCIRDAQVLAFIASKPSGNDWLSSITASHQKIQTLNSFSKFTIEKNGKMENLIFRVIVNEKVLDSFNCWLKPKGCKNSGSVGNRSVSAVNIMSSSFIWKHIDIKVQVTL